MRIHTTQSGFTLVELLVSLTLFTVVVTMTMGSLLVVIDANARAQNMQEVMTNLTFALDSMTREIRTGRAYYCINSLPSSLSDTATRDCTQGTSLSFVEGGTSLTAGGDPRVAYRLNNERIERRLGTEDWVPITSDTVAITTMEFTITGSDTYLTNADTAPPAMVLYIEGHAGEISSVETSFQLQTGITKRILDI